MDKLTLKLDGKAVEVMQDDNGRYCLNDIFRASGVTQTKKPSEWLRFKGDDMKKVKAWESDKAGFPTISEMDFDTYVVQTKLNRATVTFAPLKVVYKYAAWISKEFEDAVYSAFTELTKGNVKEAADIASSVTITPEIIARYEYLQAKLNKLLKERYPDNQYIYSNIYRLLGKVVSGYTPKELTGGFSSVIEYVKSKDHLPAINAYIASIELIMTLIIAGVTDYHIIAASLQVKTSKNGSILKEIQ